MYTCHAVFLLALFVPSCVAIFFGFGNAGNSSEAGGLLSLFSVRPWLNLILPGERPNCGPPRSCPNYTCRNNPAVVHGYCCGCASPFDTIRVPCPGNLQCPIFREPLCTDYRYMIDCCCNR